MKPVQDPNDQKERAKLCDQMIYGYLQNLAVKRTRHDDAG
jgi:hypothetical protein